MSSVNNTSGGRIRAFCWLSGMKRFVIPGRLGDPTEGRAGPPRRRMEGPAFPPGIAPRCTADMQIRRPTWPSISAKSGRMVVDAATRPVPPLAHDVRFFCQQPANCLGFADEKPIGQLESMVWPTSCPCIILQLRCIILQLSCIILQLFCLQPWPVNELAPSSPQVRRATWREHFQVKYQQSLGRPIL